MKALVTSLAVVLGFGAGVASAQDLVIRNARVHTVDTAGTLEATDVAIAGGTIRAIGKSLAVPAGAATIDANGRALTPGLFAGLTALGVQEVSLEAATVDNALAFGAQQPPQDPQWRPEFDITLAYNAHSMPIGVNRVEGVTFGLLAPVSAPGGSLIAGQGAVALFDGRDESIVADSRTLFVGISGDLNVLSGGSRAAQYMLLEQAIGEVNGGEVAASPLLTSAGRATLGRYLGGGHVVFRVDRAADIRRVLAFAQRHRINAVIAGGAEAWEVAAELARAKVPVLVDGLLNLPQSFDQLGARIDNAAILSKAGVTVVFSQGGEDTHNARKLRQLAGVAVAHGMDWDAALAAITANPARVFGAGARVGRIATGLRADLVLWSGDPLEVTSFADQVIVDGRAIEMRSRQTDLRDRYLQKLRAHDASR